MIRISDEDAEKIIQDGNAGAIQALCINPGISPEIALKLFSSYPKLILNNPGWDKFTVERPGFAQEAFELNANIILAIDNLAASWLTWLITLDSEQVKLQASQHPNLSEADQRICCDSPNIWLKKGLAQNTNTKYELLQQLSFDPNAQISQAARNNPIYQIYNQTRSHSITTDIPTSDAPTTSIQPVAPSTSNRQQPLIFVLVFLVLVCIALASILGSNNTKKPTPGRTQQSSSISTNSNPQPITDEQETNYRNLFDDAVKLAKSNVDLAAEAKTIEEWTIVEENWRSAINLLNQIPVGSRYQISAASRISSYKVSSALAQERIKKLKPVTQ